MAAKVTIREVAKEAGVSLQTVSRVINNGPNVSAKAKKAVEDAVAKLGYSPSIAARRMGGSKSYLLLALNDRDRTIEDWQNREGTDWVDQMLLGGMLKCAEHGYRMIFELVDTHSDNIERELNRALAAMRPDGVILTPPHSDNPHIVKLLASKGVACARIGGFAPLGGYSIRMDDHASSVAAVDHLVELGHKKIAFIAGNPEYQLSEVRLAGYRDAMEKHGLAVDDSLIGQGDFGHASGSREARKLLSLDNRPTAIIASSDAMALGCLEVAREMGLKVPEDLSVIGYDNTPIARSSIPPLTAIEQKVAAMTSRAAELLIKPPEREDEDGDLIEMIDFDLAVRKSTGPAPR